MTQDYLQNLPGADLIRQGLEDRKANRKTVPSCLVAIASPRLERLGLIAGNSKAHTNEPELELYRLLRQKEGDAFSQYQSLIRQLVSFERALEHQSRLRDKAEARKQTV